MRFRRDGRSFATAVKVWFFALQKKSQIAILVVLAHLSAILWMCLDYCFSDRPIIPHHVVVHTVQPLRAPIHIAPPPSQKMTKVPVAQTPAVPPTPIAPQAKAIASKTKKQIITPARSNKKIGNAPQPKTIPAENIQFIKEAIHSIATAPDTHKTNLAEIKLPAALQLKSTTNASIEEEPFQESISSTYSLSLINLLQSSLQLPELGDVRVKITLLTPGTLSSFQILDAKSEKNAEWIKNQLPLLLLPCFNDFGIVDATLEFTITFRNVENN